MKIGIGLPTNRLVKSKTALSLLKLVSPKYEYEIIVSTRGYNTAENRNWISAQAVKKGCDYLFMADDDMIYEPDTIDRLLDHKKDIVGGAYYTKYEKQELVIEYLKDKEIGQNDTLNDGEYLKVAALGGGLLLIKTDVFIKTPQPWYGYKWNSSGAVKESNDWFFCNKARESGFDIWCDMNVTAKHIGQYEY